MDAKLDFVTVDGRRFHHVWLRDNCPCPRCCDRSSYQKINDPCERDAVPVAIETEGGALVVSWSDDPVPHRIPLDWLRANTYDGATRDQPARARVLWNRAWIDANAPPVHDWHGNDAESWRDQLFELGFARLRNLKPEELVPFVSSIGPVNFYARQEPFVDVKIVPGGEDLSMTSFALSPHTDQSYMTHTHPMVLVLYCYENSVAGGESMLVDGLQVVSDLKREAREDFAILSSTKVRFEQFDPSVRYWFRRTTPILELGDDGEVAALHFSHKNFLADLPFEVMGRFYAAYKALLERLKSQRYQYVFRLEPGECMVVENDRVLHGRRAFDARSGARHFTSAFVSWDYVAARRDYMRREALERERRTGATPG
jgi:alpha-ketoglutarate-dependent taurine dioxygenase